MACVPMDPAPEGCGGGDDSKYPHFLTETFVQAYSGLCNCLKHLVISTHRLVISTYRLVISTYRLVISTYCLVISTYRLVISTYRLVISTYRLVISTYCLVIGTYVWSYALYLLRLGDGGRAHLGHFFVFAVFGTFDFVAIHPCVLLKLPRGGNDSSFRGALT